MKALLSRLTHEANATCLGWDGSSASLSGMRTLLYTSQRQFPFIVRVPWSPQITEVICALPLDSGLPLPSPAFPPHQHSSYTPEPAKPFRNNGSESEMLSQTHRPGKVNRCHPVHLFLFSGVLRRKVCCSKACNMFNKDIRTLTSTH